MSGADLQIKDSAPRPCENPELNVTRIDSGIVIAES